MTAYKDNNGSWYVKLRYTDYTGKKRQKMKRGFKLLKDAKEWETDFLARYSGQPDMTFRTLMDIYMQDRKQHIKAATYIHKESRMKRWLLPYFGDMPISEITPRTVREWQNNLKEHALVSGSMRNINADLSGALNYAVSFLGLSSNPCHAATGAFGKDKHQINFWTKEEFDRFISTFDKSDPYYAAFNVLYYTGIRFGEMSALTIGDIDFKAHTLSITKTLYRHGGKFVITAPKTEKSNRIITLPLFLCEIIKNHISHIYAPEFDTPLFIYHHNQIYKRVLQSHAEQAGIKTLRIHDLRHSHASLLIELGFSPLLVSERLGHENVTTTLNIYAHMFPSKQVEVADKLDRIQ